MIRERYAIRRLLSESAQARVFEVRDVELLRTVALKLGSSSESAQLANEASLVSALEHPAIVRVHAFDRTAEGRPFFTMPLLAGPTLRAVLGRWSLPRLVRALSRVANGLAHAHANGVVHGRVALDVVHVGEYGEIVLIGWSRAQRGAPGGPLVREDIAALGSALEEVLATRERPPGALVAVRDKCLEGDGHGYRAMAEVADDLQAWLEHRVVRAHGTGAWVELQKWLVRNRTFAAAVAGLTCVASLALTASLSAQAHANDVLRAQEHELDSALETLEAASMRARSRTEMVGELTIATDLKRLGARAEQLWPATPERVPAYDEWLLRAEQLGLGLAARREALARLRTTGTRAPGGAQWSFEDEEDAWLHGELVTLVEGLESLGEELVPDVRDRRAAAVTIGARSTRGEFELPWARAIESIADPRRCPRYGGLVLTPVQGLAPLGRDPDSGLWEFVDVRTGSAPTRDPGDGRLLIGEASGLVLVLLPGGPAVMGAQATDPRGANFDPQAKPDEGPVHGLELAPFFCSKYEMTRGQWARLAAEASPRGAGRGDYPVHTVSWNDCERVLRRAGLGMPTEAQWEYAARAGRQTPWWTGSGVDSLEGYGNLSDASHRAVGNQASAYLPWDDGFAELAPVDSLCPNPFGLHGFLGNLAEWCQDRYAPYRMGVRPGTGARVDLGNDRRVIRGAAFFSPPFWARAAYRHARPQNYAYRGLGVRPVRQL